MVTADGRAVQVTNPDKLRRDSFELWDAGDHLRGSRSRSSHGRRSGRVQAIKLDRWLKRGSRSRRRTARRILGGAAGFLGFLLPYRHELLVERPPAGPRSPPDRGLGPPEAVDAHARVDDGRPPFKRATAPAAEADPAQDHRRLGLTLDHGFLKVFFLKFLSRFASFRADAMIDFKRPVSSYFDFTFWHSRSAPGPRSSRSTSISASGSSGKPAFGRRCPPRSTSSGGTIPLSCRFSADEDIFHAGHGELVGRRAGVLGAMNRAFSEFAAERAGDHAQSDQGAHAGRGGSAASPHASLVHARDRACAQRS